MGVRGGHPSLCAPDTLRPLVAPQYMIPCEKVPSLPDVTVTLGGKKYKLSSENYTLKVSGRPGHGVRRPGWRPGG